MQKHIANKQIYVCPGGKKKNVEVQMIIIVPSGDVKPQLTGLQDLI